MFEEDIPNIKLGGLLPLPIIDNAAYEFYRLAPKGVMQVMISVGLSEFSAQDVNRAFSPLDSYLDQLMDRGVNMVAQHGVPLPILIGVEAHDRMIAHMAKRTGLPASSTVLAVARSAGSRLEWAILATCILFNATDDLLQTISNRFGSSNNFGDDLLQVLT